MINICGEHIGHVFVSSPKINVKYIFVVISRRIEMGDVTLAWSDLYSMTVQLFCSPFVFIPEQVYLELVSLSSLVAQ